MKTWNSTFKYGNITNYIYILYDMLQGYMGDGLWAMGYGLWAAGYGYGLWVWAAGYGLWLWAMAMGCGLWVMGCGLWVGLWAAYYTCLGMVPRHFHGAIT